MTSQLRTLADAVMYEGYMLWPYRASALKNQRRWTFGCVFPPAWTALHPDDACLMQTQVLVEGSPSVTVRFLDVDGVEHCVGPGRFASGVVEVSRGERLEVVIRNTSEWAGEDREEALRHA